MASSAPPGVGQRLIRRGDRGAEGHPGRSRPRVWRLLFWATQADRCRHNVAVGQCLGLGRLPRTMRACSETVASGSSAATKAYRRMRFTFIASRILATAVATDRRTRHSGPAHHEAREPALPSELGPRWNVLMTVLHWVMISSGLSPAGRPSNHDARGNHLLFRRIPDRSPWSVRHLRPTRTWLPHEGMLT